MFQRFLGFQCAKPGRPESEAPFVAKMASFDDERPVISTRPLGRE